MYPRITLFLLTAAALAAPAHAKSAESNKTYAAQATVAAKTAFATLAATDKTVTQALKATALAEAQKRVGKPGAFQGVVTDVHVGHGNSIVILNFAPDYHDALTAVVKPADYARFPVLAQLKGKRVLIQGTFMSYHGSPEVDLTVLSQIRIIQ